jgi:hypothetical protein
VAAITVPRDPGRRSPEGPSPIPRTPARSRPSSICCRRAICSTTSSTATSAARCSRTSSSTWSTRSTGFRRSPRGKGCKALVESLERLRGTNIRSGDEEQIDTFGLVESSSVRREFGLDGRLTWVEVTSSDRVFDAIRNQEAPTLHPHHFRLRKPMGRRIHGLAREHCGQQRQWRCGIGILHEESGAKSPPRHFRYPLKDIAASDHLPDHTIEMEEGGEMARFTNRGTMHEAAGRALADRSAELRLSGEAFEAAR